MPAIELKIGEEAKVDTHQALTISHNGVEIRVCATAEGIQVLTKNEMMIYDGDVYQIVYLVPNE